MIVIFSMLSASVSVACLAQAATTVLEATKQHIYGEPK